MSNSFEKIYDVIRTIPEGKVATYGQVAELAGNRRWARVVGYALHALTSENDVPWHRVVTKEGRPFPGADERLEAEGVELVGGCVDMDTSQWKRILF